MQQQTKERIQYGSAMVVLAFAIALVYISYFVSKDVTDNVLWYFGQSLMYVASIFGVSIKKIIDHNKDEKED